MNAKIARTAEIGDKAKDLSKKKISIAGLGSAGSHLAEIFARMGISLRIVDKGRIEEEDISSCALFLPGEETKFKAKEAKKHLEKINPKASVKSFHEELSKINVFLLESELVIDCSQDWNTSLLINKLCKEKKIPLIYVRIAGAEGIVMAHKNGFPHTKLESHVEKIGAVKEKGLLPSTVDMATSIVLAKALKILAGESYSDKAMHFNSWKMSRKEIKL